MSKRLDISPEKSEYTHRKEIHNAKAKEIIKMMNMVEAQKQTFGVEIEMNNITRRDAAKLAAEFFGTGRFEDTARRNGYCTWSAWMADGREWKFQKDVSIAGPDSQKCEMVTPILTYEDMETLQELVRILRKAGARSDATRGCGVHYALPRIIKKISENPLDFKAIYTEIFS